VAVGATVSVGSVERITPRFVVLYQANVASEMLELAVSVVELPEHIAISGGRGGLTLKLALVATVTVTVEVVDGLPQGVLAVTV
jgi:hypothetical protein